MELVDATQMLKLLENGVSSVSSQQFQTDISLKPYEFGSNAKNSAYVGYLNRLSSLVYDALGI
jgi:hypothetical protein